MSGKLISRTIEYKHNYKIIIEEYDHQQSDGEYEIGECIQEISEGEKVEREPSYRIVCNGKYHIIKGDLRYIGDVLRWFGCRYNHKLGKWVIPRRYYDKYYGN